jgi:hypothetical protein
LHQIDKARRRIVLAPSQLVYHAAKCRPAAERREVLGVESRLALKRVVRTGRADQRPHEDQFAGQRRQLGQVLANVVAGDPRGNAGKLTADFARRIGLEVDSVEVRRPAVEMDEDHPLA